jgi:Cu+-exporting ATPase
MNKIPCDHCHLEFDKEVLFSEVIEGKEKFFCCKGCQGVYHLLKDEGLDNFYDKVGSTKLNPATECLDDLTKYDHEGFAKKYIKEVEHLREISLIIEGIHCSACVWLNEKVLYKTEGIIEAEINYTNHKAKILWDPSVLKLSDILRKIQSIGYNAYPYDASLQEQKVNAQRKDYYMRLLVGVFGTMNIMWLAIAQYGGYFTGMREDIKFIIQVAEFILATPVLFYTGWIYFKGAYYGLKNHFVNMDSLVATGASLTYIYSIYAMVTGRGESYFDSVVMIITFVFVGKYLEVLSKKKAVDTLDTITSSLPTEVVVIRGEEKAILGVEEVEVGDIIELRPGDKIVIDGIILSGEGAFDESSLTGESRPIYKTKGDELLSGVIALDSVVRYQTTKVYGDSMLSTIVSLLENSLIKKPKIEKLANEISGYFSTAILVIALLTFVGWYVWQGDFEHALIIGISVIVIACPCALGLATPMATLIGLSVGAKRGILFKEASFLETMAKADVVLLDKTGTITKGAPEVTYHDKRKEYDINLLYALVKGSTHPISKGIATYLEAHYEHLVLYTLQQQKHIEAKGLKAYYQGQALLGGNPTLFEDLTISEKEGSLFIFAIDGEVVDIFVLNDTIKEGAKEAIAEIKAEGIEVVMLTGDNAYIAKKIANEVGILDVKHSLLPKEKAAVVDAYHDNGKIVVMVGDGINDALALSKSDIAIAMGSGADISVEVSDVVLLDDSMQSLALAEKLSQKTYTNIKQNLSISLLYNLITIPLAVMGYVIPLVAALSMSLSSLLVIANAVRIKKGF